MTSLTEAMTARLFFELSLCPKSAAGFPTKKLIVWRMASSNQTSLSQSCFNENTMELYVGDFPAMFDVEVKIPIHYMSPSNLTVCHGKWSFEMNYLWIPVVFPFKKAGFSYAKRLLFSSKQRMGPRSAGSFLWWIASGVWELSKTQKSWHLKMDHLSMIFRS